VPALGRHYVAAQRAALLRQLRLVNPPDEMDLPPHFPVAIPDFVLKLAAADRPCAHLDQITVVEPTTSVCGQCIESGDIWPALRMCLSAVMSAAAIRRRTDTWRVTTRRPAIRSSARSATTRAGCGATRDDAFFEKTLLDRYR
jgi:hypothetical protein